jgi:hypothetical protein
MGQKVNPILLRSKYRKVDSSTSLISPPQNSEFSHSLIQDIEVKKFLYFLLLSKGIFLRSCTLKKTPEKVDVQLDMYFTSLFFKKSKLRWVKYFFRTMKKEETSFKKIKEVKGFVDTHFSIEKKKKKFKYIMKRKQSFLKKLRLGLRKGKKERKQALVFSRETKVKTSKEGKKQRSLLLIRNLLRREKEKDLTPFFKSSRLKKGEKKGNLISRLSVFKGNQILDVPSDKKLKTDGVKKLGKGKKSFKSRALSKSNKFSKLKKFGKLKKVNDFEILYNRRLFYILCYQKKKGLFVNKEEEQDAVSSFSQLHKKPGFDLVKTNLSKLSRFFGMRKLKYSFYSLCLRKFMRQKKRDQSLLQLNKFLGQVLQKYYGIEQVCVKMTSMQLFLLPFLKCQKKVFVKKLSSFERNRSLQKYFSETVELFYFLHVCFSKGNAFLLAKFIAYLLEKNRKQLIIVKFLRKCMQAFFTGVSRLSSKRLRKEKKNLSNKKIKKSSSLRFLAISGMRILIKGRLNKRRRTKKFLFSSGQFSLQTMDLGVDYYQTQANTIYGSFGIKVWIAKRK